MARNYKKRTTSTKLTTYDDYLAMYADLEAKGYSLQRKFSEKNFNEYIKVLKIDQKNGEFKGSIAQQLKKRIKKVSAKQAKALSVAASNKKYVEELKKKAGIEADKMMSSEEIAELEGKFTEKQRNAIKNKTAVSAINIKKMDDDERSFIVDYLNMYKNELFSGNYE